MKNHYRCIINKLTFALCGSSWLYISWRLLV